MPPTVKDVIDHASYLENLQGEKEMRDRTRRIHDSYAMRSAIELPEWVARGKTREIPLSDLIDMAYSIQSERHGHQTAVILTARDKTPQTQVDRIERWLSTRAAQHLKRWHLLDEGGWHQLLSYAGIVTWHCEEAHKPIHSRIETPDPLTFFFPSAGAPGRPLEFARKFDMQLSEAGQSFADGNRRPYMKGSGIWDWYVAGGDRPSDEWTGGTKEGSRFGHTCTVIHDDDGEYTTYVGLNKTKTGHRGEILWQDRNHGGPDEYGHACSQSIVVPGMVNPMRHPKDRLLPMFIPGIQAQNALNYLIALIASKIENSQPNVLLEQDAETMKARNNQGILQGAGAEMEPGSPNFIRVLGKPVEWKNQDVPFLVDLLNFWKERYDRWSNSLREISDPTLLSEINTNVYLPHSAARRKLLRPLIDFTNSALSEILRMDVLALEKYGRKSVELYARGGEYRGKGMVEMAVGESSTISWEDVKGWDERFVLTIATNDMSEEERRQMLLHHEEKVQMGYATKRQGIPIAGYADENAQILELAEDEVYQEGTALVKPQIPTAIQQAIYYEGGMLLPLEQLNPVPGAGGAPPAPTQGTTYNTPTVPGAQGANAPVVQQAAPVGVA